MKATAFNSLPADFFRPPRDRRAVQAVHKHSIQFESITSTLSVSGSNNSLRGTDRPTDAHPACQEGSPLFTVHTYWLHVYNYNLNMLRRAVYTYLEKADF